jgi:hypothetical protein
VGGQGVKNGPHTHSKAGTKLRFVTPAGRASVEILWFFNQNTNNPVKNVKKVIGIPQLGVMTL